MQKKKKIAVQKTEKSPKNDPMGSYTGIVTDPYGNPVYEEPVQDVDDL